MTTYDDSYKVSFNLKKWNGVPVDEETIQEWIRETVEYLQRHPEEKDTSCLSGDTMVTVTRMCEFFEVTVSKIERCGLVPSNINPNPKRPWSF